MRVRSFLCWSPIAILACCGLVQAQELLFDSENVLDIELHGPLKRTIRDSKDRKERDFKLLVDGREVPVGVRVRGKSRVAFCRFPPLRLNFSSSDTTDTVFSGQGKLKLVTHCKESRTYEQNTLEEYAAYRMFSTFSDVAFRVRLLRIRYVDTADPKKRPLVRYGFLLESEKDLARRVQGEVMRAPHVVKSLLKAEQAALVFGFQYLIGNTDWSLVTATGAKRCCHNGALVNIGGLHYYVPYDFDHAGLVNARYAKPNPSIGTRSVRSRRYRGYCIEGLQISDAIAAIREAEEGIREIIQTLPGATAKDTRSRLKYLQPVFDAARDGDKLEKRFENRCIG